MSALLLGCGNSRVKKVAMSGEAEWNGRLETIDMDPACKPTVHFDLSRVGSGLFKDRLPWESAEFDEIHAYDVLEHWGAQGDWRAWFNEMAEYHRLLKPGGTMGILVPIGLEAHADPGHTRFFGTNHFWMLSQRWYAEQLAAGKAITDYRWFWKRDFEVLEVFDIQGHHIAALLRKPA